METDLKLPLDSFTMVCTGGFFWLYRFYEIDALETSAAARHFAWQSEVEQEGGPGGGHYRIRGYHDRLLPEVNSPNDGSCRELSQVAW